MESPLRNRLRSALPTALRARDAAAVSALRTALAAIDNAEAVDVPALRGAAPAEPLVGLGAGEAARRELTQEEILAIVRAEVTDRRLAARDYVTAGRPDRAARLEAEAAALEALL